jgi:hypothetical protein
MIAMTRPAACHTGKHQRIDHALRPHQPIEAEPRQPKVMTDFLDAQCGVEQPPPGESGNDERHRERIQKHRAQQTLGAHTLIDQRRQREPQRHRHRDEQHAEDRDVLH